EPHIGYLTGSGRQQQTSVTVALSCFGLVLHGTQQLLPNPRDITTNLAKAKSGVTVVVKEWLARVAELGHVRCKRRSMETDTAAKIMFSQRSWGSSRSSRLAVSSSLDY
ncbi:hypothetical protein ILYODFUR_006614, partial [Ilyodon furcidens]